MVGIGHAGNGVHRRADGRPVLAAGGDIGVGALAEHVAGQIVPGTMEPLRRVQQEPLHRLGLALTVGVAVVDGAGLLVVIRPVGEADIVELDLVEAQRCRLQRQIHLVLPHRAVVGAGPVHMADLQGRAAQVADDLLRVIRRQMGVVEHGDAADEIVSRVLQLPNVGPEALHGVHGRRVGRRTVLLHHRRGVGHGGAVHDVHHKGVDAAALRHPKVAVGVLDSRAVEIQRPHLVRHVVAGNGALLHGIVVQPRRVAAAPAVAPGGVELIQRLVILSQRFLLRHADVGGGDIALAPVAGDAPAQHLAVLIQPVKAGDCQGHALFHGAAGYGPRLIQQAHAPQGVHRLHLHRVLIAVGQVLLLQQDIRLAVDHPDTGAVAVQIHQHIVHLRAPGQGTQHRPLLVIYQGGRLRRRHIPHRRLRRRRRQLLTIDIHTQTGQSRQTQQDDDDPRRAALSAGSLFC